MLHRRQYVLKTCHIVWNILICMYYFSRKFLPIIFFLISRLFREDIFKDCGEVVDIQFKTDCEGRFRGFGFVKFETVEAAQKVSLCPYVIYKSFYRPIQCKYVMREIKAIYCRDRCNQIMRRKENHYLLFGKGCIKSNHRYS